MYQNSELLEMEAHIPCNSYFPLYFSTMNHNLRANGSERNHNLSSDQLFGYYKEAIKQTMLNQEMIFKDQILDLHRLYGRQRELMNEIRKNELDKLGMDASRPTTSLSQSSLLCTQKTFNIPCLPLVSSACSQVSISGADNIQSPSCFVQGRNIQACSYPAQTKGNLGDHEFIKSKCKKSQKNLDLRLPDDAIYIDSEEEELLEDRKVSEAPEVSSYPMKRTPEVVCKGNERQFLCTAGVNSISNYASSAASLEKGSVDLNYVYKLEEETAPASDNFWGPTSQTEILCSDASQKTKSHFQNLSNKFFQATQTRHDFEAYSNVLLQGSESKQEWSSYNYKAGKIQSNLCSLPQGLHADNLSLSSNSSHEKIKQADEPASFHQNNHNSSSERAMTGVQSSRRQSAPKNDHQSGPSGAFTCTSYQHNPHDYIENSGSSCIAALRKPILDLARSPIIVQALPCLNTSVPLSDSCKSSTVRVNDGLVTELHGITKYLQDSANVNALKDIDLNFMPPSCSLDAAVSQSFQTTRAEKLEDSNERFPLHRPKLDFCGKTDKGCEDSNQAEANDFLSKTIHGSPTCESPNISGDHCYHLSHSNPHRNSAQDVKNSKGALVLDLNVACDSELKEEVERTADEHVEESKFKKDVGFGVHIDLNTSINDGGFGVHIDLNSSLNEDEFSPMSSPSSEILLEAPASPENKESSPPRGVSSDGNQVDTPDLTSGLEAPENKECSLPRGESDENQVDAPFPLSEQEDIEHKVCSQPTESDEQGDPPFPPSVQEELKCKVCSQPTESNEQIETPVPLSKQGGLQNKECSQPIESDEDQIVTPFPLSNLESKDCSQPMDSDEKHIETPFPLSGQEVHLEEELFRTAAECLVSISSSGFRTCSERTKFKPFKTSCDSLHWFAGLASSVLGNLENELGCGDHEEVLPDGIDYFEAMTLKLTETKVEECCCCRSNGRKEVEMGPVSSQSQPRKGRPRKGRQRRKDFQSEILPGLASLSRYEVTEDLQIIGTLIEASAGCSETRSVRHAAKFGLARGRRRCTISDSTVAENTSPSPLKHIGVKRQLESEERSLIDWGDVTRRRRGQRNPVSDRRLIISQV